MNPIRHGGKDTLIPPQFYPTIGGRLRYLSIMLPGRALIYELEQLLFEHHPDAEEISGKLDEYIIDSVSDKLDQGDSLHEEYEGIKQRYPEGSKERLNALLDMILGEVEEEIESIEPRAEMLREIEDELEKLTIYEEE